MYVTGFMWVDLRKIQKEAAGPGPGRTWAGPGPGPPPLFGFVVLFTGFVLPNRGLSRGFLVFWKTITFFFV